MEWLQGVCVCVWCVWLLCCLYPCFLTTHLTPFFSEPQADHRYRAKIRRIASVLAHKSNHHLRDLVSGVLTPRAIAAMDPSELVHEEV